VPLSCWFGAGILEVVAGRRASPYVRRLTGIGVLATLPAAASGSADWMDTSGAEQRVGTVHVGLNGLAATAFAASWWARRSGRVGRGRVWSLLGLTAAGASGFLGGHLSYRRGVGIDTTAFQSGPTEWKAVATLDHLPQGKPVGVEVDGVVIMLVRRNAVDVDALEARCTHRGGPLHEGSVDHWCVTCPWHGSRFVLHDGSIDRGPASAPQPAYETRTRGSSVEIRRTEHGSLRRSPVRSPNPESRAE
jgi:nitrite reductase/ring-hydroxylating ferredoxin subunit